MHGTAEQVEDAPAERLALQIPKGDIDSRRGVGSNATVIAVPPGLLLILPPQRLGMNGIFADQVRRHSFNDCFCREIGLGKLGNRLAPADLPVVGGNLPQAQMAESVEVVRLGIADRNRLYFCNAHFYPLSLSRRGTTACL